MSVSSTRSDRYFAAMGAEEDFSRFFDDDVTWLIVDSGEEVRGPGPVRDYLLELHNRMLSEHQRDLVVTDGHAFLEGHSVNAGSGNGSGLGWGGPRPGISAGPARRSISDSCQMRRLIPRS